MTLPAFAAERGRRQQISIDISARRALSSKPAARRRCCCRSTLANFSFRDCELWPLTLTFKRPRKCPHEPEIHARCDVEVEDYSANKSVLDIRLRTRYGVALWWASLSIRYNAVLPRVESLGIRPFHVAYSQPLRKHRTYRIAARGS